MRGGGSGAGIGTVERWRATSDSEHPVVSCGEHCRAGSFMEQLQGGGEHRRMSWDIVGHHVRASDMALITG